MQYDYIYKAYFWKIFNFLLSNLKIPRLENDTLTINATYLDVSIIST